MVRLIESKEDQQLFIDKFGQELYDKLQKIKNTPYVNDFHVNDLTYCVNRYTKEQMETLIEDAYIKSFTGKFDKRFGGALTYRFNKIRNDFFDGKISDINEEMLEYSYWYKKSKRELVNFIREYGYSNFDKQTIEIGTEVISQEDDWIAYKIKNYPASEYYGLGSGWCICGAYPGNYEKGRNYFSDYAPYYYFFINEEADERYCFFIKNGMPQLWDGSHGCDTEITDTQDKTIPDGLFEEICELEDVDPDFSQSVPEDPDDQISLISDFINDIGIDNFLDQDMLINILQYKDILEGIYIDNKEQFIYDLDPEEQFDELQANEISVGIIDSDEEIETFDQFESYEQAVDILGYDDFSEWAAQYAEAVTPDNLEDFLLDMYGSFSPSSIKSIARDFDVTPTDIANYIVYEIDEGPDYCGSILDARRM